MTTGTPAMTRDDDSVSPYLLRRLRSLQEALRERAKASRPKQQPQDSSPPGRSEPPRNADGKAGDDV